MSWDLEINIEAPIDKVFEVAATWYKFPELLELASVRKYHPVSEDHGKEYFWLRVKDLPFKSTYCYGKRLLRKPDMLLNIFTYRVFKKPALAQPEELEKLIQKDWDQFFYQTTRLRSINPRWTKLMVAEPGSDASAPDELVSLKTFYNQLRKIAEGQLVRLGVDAVAEPVDPDEEIYDDGFVDPEEGQPFETDENYDAYTVLGIRREASADEIKQAYRSLARQWHPDRLASQGGAMREYGHNQFIEITAAYHAILRERDL